MGRQVLRWSLWPRASCSRGQQVRQLRNFPSVLLKALFLVVVHETVRSHATERRLCDYILQGGRKKTQPFSGSILMMHYLAVCHCDKQHRFDTKSKVNIYSKSTMDFV